jgi:hypothetical protein
VVTAALRADGIAVGPAFGFGVAVHRYDRRGELLDSEAAALAALGAAGLRRHRATGVQRTAAHWKALARLVEPLDAARARLHHRDDVRFRRAGAHAVAIILANCVARGRSYWAWTGQDWAGLCGSSARAFVADRDLPTEATVRPFLVAIGYLLDGFDEFHLLGMINRLHLARLVFGEGGIDASIRQATETLDRWGYRGALNHQHRLRGGLSQALLINRSPRLEDLDTAAFARLRAHPGPTITTASCCSPCSVRSPGSGTVTRRCVPVACTCRSLKAPQWSGPDGSSGGMPPPRSP